MCRTCRTLIIGNSIWRNTIHLVYLFLVEMLNIKLVEGQEYKVAMWVLGGPRKQILLGVGAEVEVEEEVGEAIET